MLKFKPVELSDRGIIQPFLDVWNTENSTLTFTSFYMWRYGAAMKYAIKDDVLYLAIRWEGSQTMFYVPIPMDKNADFNNIMQQLMEFYCQDGSEFKIRCVSDDFKEWIEKTAGDKLVFEEDRDNFDYIYNSQDLITFAGKKYHGKRNHINRLLSLYDPIYEPYTPELYDECWDLYQQWLENKDEDAPGMDGEPVATRSALQDFQALGLKGCVIRIDGKIEGFAIGEQIREDMAVIHVEKANASIQGMYPYLTQQFVANEWSHVPFINRMEDMGIENMRKAKLSLHPAKLLAKYTITLKDQ